MCITKLKTDKDKTSAGDEMHILPRWGRVLGGAGVQLLVEPLCLTFGLWVVSGGEADSDTEERAEGFPELRDELWKYK